MKFIVLGTPRPQGSMRAFKNRWTDHAMMKSDNPKTYPWRHDVAQVAMLQRPECHEGPVAISLDFYFQRPKSAPKSRTMPIVKPDLDKLTRAILDALKGICWRDDAQVVRFGHVEKHYGTPERVEIYINPL